MYVRWTLEAAVDFALARPAEVELRQVVTGRRSRLGAPVSGLAARPFSLRFLPAPHTPSLLFASVKIEAPPRSQTQFA